MTGAKRNQYGLGLEAGVNCLTDYNPLWPRAFAEEAGRIRPVIGPLALAIEHYGSTAVPRLRAKPIIDLLIGVADINHGLRMIEPMVSLGYDYAGNQGIPEHHVFGRGAVRTHLAHVVVYEGEQWRRSLAFRDRLRASPMDHPSQPTVATGAPLARIAFGRWCGSNSTRSACPRTRRFQRSRACAGSAAGRAGRPRSARARTGRSTMRKGEDSMCGSPSRPHLARSSRRCGRIGYNGAAAGERLWSDEPQSLSAAALSLMPSIVVARTSSNASAFGIDPGLLVSVLVGIVMPTLGRTICN
jgi:GrpB-like predicted nucleotidyltransferase (UPF0157 family)